MDFYRAQVLVCGGTGCTSSGSGEIVERFEEQIRQNGLEKEIKIVRTGCFGLCEAGPVVIVYPEGTFYSRVRVDDVAEIVSEHLVKGRTVQHLVYKDKNHEGDHHLALEEIEFYKKQKRIALRIGVDDLIVRTGQDNDFKLFQIVRGQLGGIIADDGGKAVLFADLLDGLGAGPYAGVDELAFGAAEFGVDQHICRRGQRSAQQHKKKERYFLHSTNRK